MDVFLVLSGGLRLFGGVFWRKSQNYAAVHVFPDVCAFHQSLQGEEMNPDSNNLFSFFTLTDLCLLD